MLPQVILLKQRKTVSNSCITTCYVEGWATVTHLYRAEALEHNRLLFNVALISEILDDLWFFYFLMIDFWLILDQYPISMSDWDSPKWGYHVGTQLIGLNTLSLTTQCEWQCSPCPLSQQWMSWITSFFTPLTPTIRKTPNSCCIELHCQQLDTWQVELFGQDDISKHWLPPPIPTHTHTNTHALNAVTLPPPPFVSNHSPLST